MTSMMRDERKRPRITQVLGRGVAITVVNALALMLLAWILPGLTIDSFGDALLAGLVLGIIGSVVWPALAFLVVPLSVLTLGVASLVLDALVVALVLDSLPGIDLDGAWSALAVAVGLSVVTTIMASLLALDDDSWFDERMARRARRRRGSAAPTDVPGIVFVQIDGLSERVLRRALSSGDAPTLHRWIREGSHELTGWRTFWSSQTGVSQCGILHGSTVDMPAFRWVEKADGKVLVSNHRSSAAEIERRHSNGKGLLAHDGSSYGNLYTGDADRAVLTMSVTGTRKEGRLGSGYGRYFSHPQQAARTLVGSLYDIAHERRAAGAQRKNGVEPRVERDWLYSLLRAFTTVVSRDVCLQGILNDVSEGRSAIYVDFLGYDEVAHHAGPERDDSLAVLRDLDRQIGRIERSFAWAPRPYRIVVLSDHGQTQGATFRQRYGETLAQVVGRLCGGAESGDRDAEEGRTESTAWFRSARGHDPEREQTAQGPTVLASGNLGLVYLPAERHRLDLEEIEQHYPALVPGLLEHDGIGFLLARSRERGAVVLGRGGSHELDHGRVVGDDPLAVFGPGAAHMVHRVCGYPNLGDLMVNSMYDPDLDEVAAFEEQVGSHGGLGGAQTHPFLLFPSDLTPPAAPIEGPVALHGVLKGWLADVGQPVERVEAAAPDRTPVSVAP